MSDYPTPIATVDIVLFSLDAAGLMVGLLPRTAAPEAGRLALPGGYVHVSTDLTLHDTAIRVLRDKIGLVPRYLEQLATRGDARRDPRGWSISVAYYVLLHMSELGGIVPSLAWHPVDALPDLAFDHGAIIGTACDRLRGKSAYSSLPAFLLPPSFTLSELHRVYQQVIGIRLDAASFRRKIEDQRIIEPAGERREGAHRPARLFRLSPSMSPEFDRRI